MLAEIMLLPAWFPFHLQQDFLVTHCIGTITDTWLEARAKNRSISMGSYSFAPDKRKGI